MDNVIFMKECLNELEETVHEGIEETLQEAKIKLAEEYKDDPEKLVEATEALISMLDSKKEFFKGIRMGLIMIGLKKQIKSDMEQPQTNEA